MGATRNKPASRWELVIEVAAITGIGAVMGVLAGLTIAGWSLP